MKLFLITFNIFFSFLGDPKHLKLIDSIANVSSSTNQNNKEELKKVSFSSDLTKTYEGFCYPQEEMESETKPSFLVGDLENMSLDEEIFEAKDDFPEEMVENGVKMSTYERNLIEKRRRLR